MRRLMRALSRGVSVLGVAAAMAGCNGGGGGSMTGPGNGPMKIALVAWVSDLAVNYAPDTHPPDTVDDKVDIVIDTSDPAAFDGLLAQQGGAQ
jgi:hypothetical protein